MIFIDTSYLLAIVNDKDQWHNKAINLTPKIKKSEKIISNIIITETLNGLTGLFNGKQIRQFYEILTNTHSVYNETKEIYKQAITIAEKYDGTIGYADCTSIAIMNKLKIYEIISFDEDFDNKEKIVRIH